VPIGSAQFTPGLFFGKGFGDLPGLSIGAPAVRSNWQVGISFPTRSTVEDERISNNLEWGIAVEYSLIYLQEHVKDIGLCAPFKRLIPLVEFAMPNTAEPNIRPTTEP